MKYLMGAVLGLGEILLIIACALIVIGALITAIVRKVKGKTSCNGDCGCCTGCTHCKSDIQADDKDLRNV